MKPFRPLFGVEEVDLCELDEILLIGGRGEGRQGQKEGINVGNPPVAQVEVEADLGRTRPL